MESRKVPFTTTFGITCFSSFVLEGGDAKNNQKEGTPENQPAGLVQQAEVALWQCQGGKHMWVSIVMGIPQ